MIEHGANLEKNFETPKEIDKYKVIADELAQFAAQGTPEEEDAKEVSGLLSALRPELRQVVEDVAEGSRVRQEVPLGYMLGVASIALGYKISNTYDFYENHPNINMIIVGESGDGKSYPLKVIKKPLDDAQDIARREFLEKRDMATPEEREKMHEKIIYTSDLTMEALKRDLMLNPNGVGVIKDEGILDALGAYKDNGGQRKDDNDFLELFNCDGFRVSRKGDKDGSMSVQHCFTAWVGGVQPCALPEMFGKTRIRRGLMARFLFVFPAPMKRKRGTGAPKKDFTAWSSAVAEMLNMAPVNLATEPAAFGILEDYRDELEDARMAADPYEKTWYAKAGIHVIRLGIILHFLGDEYRSAILTADDARHAVAFMRYFTRQWLKVYRETQKGAPGKTESLPEIASKFYSMYLEKIKQEGGEPRMTQGEFADLIGVSRGYFSRLIQVARRE